jgi:pyrroloquinoline quinone biosynthesis protein E
VTEERPYTLVAEVTHRCPLGCAYCSNPVDLARRWAELDTETWIRVLREAVSLGVLHVHLTGGEPLLRGDLERLVAEARRLDLYTQLVTSGVPVDRARLARLRAAGLDAIQLSFQDADAAAADDMAGARVHARKLAVARWARELGLPLTINVVVHRGNIAHVDALIALAERLGADRLELANAQYLGWALRNRDALLPDADRVERARESAARARRRLGGRMDVAFVLPDYHAGYPKPCMDGWARRYVIVTPDGTALPCHAAGTIAGLRFGSVRDESLADVWLRSPGFEAFRGEAWMREPCRSCPQRARDFGGCRCQAYHLTGDAAATDPACRLAPSHALVAGARASARDDAARARRA